jgi:hypothetical protein
LKTYISKGFFAATCAIFSALSCYVTAKEAPSLESAFTSTTTKISTTSIAVNVPVEWTFTNHSTETMAVEKFDESCGCLSGQAQLQGMVPVEPGKTGTIRATFTPGGYRGIVRKSLHVRFVGHPKSIELVVEANIPSSVEVSNKEPVWVMDEEIKPQIIEVTTGTGEDFNIKSLQGVPESLFKITQETVTPKRHYRIQITPLNVGTPDLQTLQIHTDSKDTRDQVLAVFLRISKTKPVAQIPSKKP